MKKFRQQQHRSRGFKRSRGRNFKLRKLIVVSLLLFVTIFLFLHFLDTNSVKRTTQTNKIEQPKSHKKIDKTTRLFSKTANSYLQQVSLNDQLPLILQKDEQWYQLPYGTGSNQDTLGVNGCAPTVLAMIASYWEEHLVEPKEIVDWAGNDYFFADVGTSWDIFPAFATTFGYNFYSPTSLQEVKTAVTEGIPVIASVKPGTFTTTGHFIVLFGDKDNRLLVFDPNDDESKNHYKEIFADEVFETDVLNYWAFYR